MITNHGFGHVLHLAVLSKIIQLTENRRWKNSASFLKRFFNKLVVFICLESLLVGSILLGTGYVAVLNF